MPSPRLFLLSAGLSTAVLAADTYTIDSNHTLPWFEVSHLGFSTQRGRFDQATGKISLDPAGQRGSVELIIDAGSINMGQAKWNDHMKSADFFNVAQFPTITYRSDQIRYEGGKPVSAEGTLTLLGVSRPVKIKIQRFTCGENPIVKRPLCAADIETTLKRSEFGMIKYLPGIGDEVHVLVPVEAFKD
jgi:polyisoprenoid-binding protein YceI